MDLDAPGFARLHPPERFTFRIRSDIPIFAFTRHERTQRRVALYRGVYPIPFDITTTRSPSRASCDTASTMASIVEAIDAAAAKLAANIADTTALISAATGYSLPDAVRTALLIARQPDPGGERRRESAVGACRCSRRRDWTDGCRAAPG